MKNAFRMSAAEIRYAYEHFFIKEMPAGMPYTMAAKVLFDEVGYYALLGWTVRFRETAPSVLVRLDGKVQMGL